eukprot:g600.t1
MSKTREEDHQNKRKKDQLENGGGDVASMFAKELVFLLKHHILKKKKSKNRFKKNSSKNINLSMNNVGAGGPSSSSTVSTKPKLPHIGDILQLSSDNYDDSSSFNKMSVFERAERNSVQFATLLTRQLASIRGDAWISNFHVQRVKAMEKVAKRESRKYPPPVKTPPGVNNSLPTGSSVPTSPGTAETDNTSPNASSFPTTNIGDRGLSGLNPRFVCTAPDLWLDFDTSSTSADELFKGNLRHKFSLNSQFLRMVFGPSNPLAFTGTKKKKKNSTGRLDDYDNENDQENIDNSSDFEKEHDNLITIKFKFAKEAQKISDRVQSLQKWMNVVQKYLKDLQCPLNVLLTTTTTNNNLHKSHSHHIVEVIQDDTKTYTLTPSFDLGHITWLAQHALNLAHNECIWTKGKPTQPSTTISSQLSAMMSTSLLEKTKTPSSINSTKTPSSINSTKTPLTINSTKTPLTINSTPSRMYEKKLMVEVFYQLINALDINIDIDTSPLTTDIALRIVDRLRGILDDVAGVWAVDTNTSTGIDHNNKTSITSTVLLERITNYFEVSPQGLNPKPCTVKGSDVDAERKLLPKTSHCDNNISDRHVIQKVVMYLRLLTVNRLENLQCLINECISCAQEQTADPKTDSRLGRVGR